MNKQEESVVDRLERIESTLQNSSERAIFKYALIGLLQNLDIIRLIVANAPGKTFLLEKLCGLFGHKIIKQGEPVYAQEMTDIAKIVCKATSVCKIEVLSGLQLTYPVHVSRESINRYIKGLIKRTKAEDKQLEEIKEPDIS
jgi:hypothetical protein